MAFKNPYKSDMDKVPERTAVVGDIEAWVTEYYETGQAAREYDERIASMSHRVEMYGEPNEDATYE
jgi:hypothetical protein